MKPITKRALIGACVLISVGAALIGFGVGRVTAQVDPMPMADPEPITISVTCVAGPLETVCTFVTTGSVERIDYAGPNGYGWQVQPGSTLSFSAISGIDSFNRPHTWTATDVDGVSVSDTVVVPPYGILARYLQSNDMGDFICQSGGPFHESDQTTQRAILGALLVIGGIQLVILVRRGR